MSNIIYASIVIISAFYICFKELKQAKQTNYTNINHRMINSIIGFLTYVVVMFSLVSISNLFILKITSITICITVIPTMIFISYKYFVNTRNVLNLVF